MKFQRIGWNWELIAAVVIIGICGIFPAAQQPPRFGRMVAAIIAGQDSLERARSLYGPELKRGSAMFGLCAKCTSGGSPKRPEISPLTYVRSLSSSQGAHWFASQAQIAVRGLTRPSCRTAVSFVVFSHPQPASQLASSQGT
jgi:hypothetical protein